MKVSRVARVPVPDVKHKSTYVLLPVETCWWGDTCLVSGCCGDYCTRHLTCKIGVDELNNYWLIWIQFSTS